MRNLFREAVIRGPGLVRTAGVEPAHLTDANIRRLQVPQKRNRVTYDAEVKGFGARITANGARSSILNYRTRYGREGRYTMAISRIGKRPAPASKQLGRSG